MTYEKSVLGPKITSIKAKKIADIKLISNKWQQSVVKLQFLMLGGSQKTDYVTL